MAGRWGGPGGGMRSGQRPRSEPPPGGGDVRVNPGGSGGRREPPGYPDARPVPPAEGTPEKEATGVRSEGVDGGAMRGSGAVASKV